MRCQPSKKSRPRLNHCRPLTSRRLKHWLQEKDWDEWDRQIEADSASGKLDFLITEAIEEKAKGTLGKL